MRTRPTPLLITATTGEVLYAADCTVSEGHVASAKVTEHPVERGAPISDHVQLESRELRVDAFTSTTPLQGAAGAERDLAAYDRLIEIRNARRPVIVTTTLGVYESMILSKVEVGRSNGDGESITAALTFRQVILTSPLAVDVPAEILRAIWRPGGKGKVDTKGGDKESGASERKSMLKAAKEGVLKAVSDLSK